jgi:hypothetical protein
MQPSRRVPPPAARELDSAQPVGCDIEIAISFDTGMGPWPTRHWRYCPSCNLAREAGDPIIGDSRRATDSLIPLGKLHSFGPLLAHAGFPIHFHKVADIMSQRKRSDKPNNPKRKGTPSREPTPVLTILNPNAAGLRTRAPWPAFSPARAAAPRGTGDSFLFPRYWTPIVNAIWTSYMAS